MQGQLKMLARESNWCDLFVFDSRPLLIFVRPNNQKFDPIVICKGYRNIVKVFCFHTSSNSMIGHVVNGI